MICSPELSTARGALFVEVTQPSESTLAAKIIRLVQEAQSEKPPSQLFMERFERLYARIILSATVLLIVLPPYLLGWTWTGTLYKAMVFLVVASPCALVASIMPAVLSAISTSARKGLLFKGGAHLENLARVKLVAFDKTGTLTTGKPRVQNLFPCQGYNENTLLQTAASIESLSEHPLAKAIVQRAMEQGMELQRPRGASVAGGLGSEGGVERANLDDREAVSAGKRSPDRRAGSSRSMAWSSRAKRLRSFKIRMPSSVSLPFRTAFARSPGKPLRPSRSLALKW